MKKAEQVAKSQAKLDEINQKIEAAEQLRFNNKDAIRTTEQEIKKLTGTLDKLDTDKRFMKAELDSQRSLYDGMIDLGNETAANLYTKTTIRETEEKFTKLSLEVESAQRALTKKKSMLEDLLGHMDQLKEDREKLTRDLDRVKRVIDQKDAQYFGCPHG